MFKGNKVIGQHGGAVCFAGTTTTAPFVANISRSKFISNEATLNGGGIWFNNEGTASVHNSLFYGNKNTGTAASGGGAIAMQGMTITITGTTIYGNDSQGSTGGGAIRFVAASTSVKIYNSIIYGNTSRVAGRAEFFGTQTIDMKNSMTELYTTGADVTNNVQVGINPLFINVSDSENVDFLQLQSTSPARQKGNASFASGILDLAENPRTQGGVDLGAYQSATTLPVEFESFDAKKVASGAQLTWKVLSETNNEKFVVERSGDAQNFTTIASVVSRGNTNQAASYSHIDNAPLNGKNYYRLSQVDRNATINVLGIKVLDFEISESAIQVYPNPATDVVRLKVGALQNSGAKVSLYSLGGAELLVKPINKSEAEQGFDLDVRSFNAGTYILFVDKGNVTEKTKIIITK